MRMAYWGVVAIMVIRPTIGLGRDIKPEIRQALAYGAEAKMCLAVCDYEGVAVSNASVRVEFDLLPVPCTIYGKTDANGRFIAIGKTNGNKIRFQIGKDGYYGCHKEMSYVKMGEEHDVKDGKWMPYGDDILIRLKPMVNPLKMSSVSIADYKFTGEICKWVGYDLEKNDFVRPFGDGEVSDFEVYIDWDGNFFPKCERIGMKIKFSEPWSGYYAVPLEIESEFPTPYAASADATFLREASYYDVRDRKRLRNKFDSSKCWIVRSRCKTDCKGNLLEANYSVVRYLGVSGSRDLKAGFAFCGAFNPTPNDTNLEDIEIAKRSRAFIRQCEPPPTP